MAGLYTMPVRAWRVGDGSFSAMAIEIEEAAPGKVVRLVRDGRKIVGLAIEPKLPGGMVHQGEWIVLDRAGRLSAYAPGMFEEVFRPAPQGEQP